MSAPGADGPNERTSQAYQELSHGLRGLARQLVRDPHGADDLVQEAWVAALRRGPEQVRDLTGWLRQVVRNLAGRSHRRELRQHDLEVLAAASEAVESEERMLERASAHRLLCEVTEELEEPHRGVVKARFFEGLSIHAIAAQTRRSESTVRRQVQHGLEELRELLDRRHLGRRDVWSAILLGSLHGTGPNAPRRARAGKSSVFIQRAAVVACLSLVPLALWLAIRSPLATPAATPVARAQEPELSESPPGELVAPLETVRSPVARSASPQGEPETAPEAPTAELRQLTVTVSTALGAPAVGTVVRIENAASGEEEFRSEGNTVFLELAREQLRHMPRLGAVGASLWARAEGEAWSLCYRVVVPPEGRALHVVTRGPPRDLFGIVVDEAGAAVPGAVVRVDSSERSMNNLETDGVFTTDYLEPRKTDENGRFQWLSLPRSPRRVSVSAAGFAKEERVVGRGSERSTATEEHAPLRIVLRRGRTLVGSVLLPDGSPAAGAHVRVDDYLAEKKGHELPATRTDTQGVYSLTGLEVGSCFVMATMPDQPELYALSLVDVPDDGTEITWDAVLAPTPPARIQIVDGSGRPVASASVVIYRYESPRWMAIADADSEGRVRFPYVAEGTIKALVTSSKADPKPVQFDFERGRENVLRLDGGPLGVASVRGSVLDDLGLLESGASILGASYVEVFNSRVDRLTGAFEASSLKPGEYELFLVAGELGATSLGSFDLTGPDLLQLEPIPIPPPRPIELDWHGERPGPSQPWVLNARFEECSLDHDVMVLEEPLTYVELLPGRYWVAPFEEQETARVSFEVPRLQSGRATSEPIRVRVE